LKDVLQGKNAQLTTNYPLDNVFGVEAMARWNKRQLPQ
jgi:hypothetical protein